MSRPSAIWILLWVVLIAFGITVWQALKVPENNSVIAEPVVTDTNRSAGVSRQYRPAPRNPAPGSLLRSLPVPQIPPVNSDAIAKQQWQDELTGLIDEASYLKDDASLRMLIVEYRNADDQIAQAAHASLMARKDSKALPYLEEMTALNLPAGTQRELQELIIFLKSKSVFEYQRDRNP